MLKPYLCLIALLVAYQPPSGGCVLKPTIAGSASLATCQPPSGGCVLKQFLFADIYEATDPAAFGRLCVETS